MTDEMDIQFEFENAVRFSCDNQPFPLVFKTPMPIRYDGTDIEVVGAVWELVGKTYVVGAITNRGECIVFVDHADSDLDNCTKVCGLVASHIALKLAAY